MSQSGSGCRGGIFLDHTCMYVYVYLGSVLDQGIIRGFIGFCGLGESIDRAGYLVSEGLIGS